MVFWSLNSYLVMALAAIQIGWMKEAWMFLVGTSG